MVEHSDEVGETAASDSGLAAVSHLGRARAGAYRGEDERGGGLGAENGLLAWPAASGGARSTMAPRGRCCCCARERGRRGSGEGTEWGCLGAQGGVPTGISRSAASTTPAYGRHVAGAEWSEAGVRTRERGEGRPGRAAWLGRKGGGSAQQRLPPFLFFLNFFSPKSLKKIFDALAKLFRGWGKNKNCSPQNSLQLFFNKKIQIPNKI